MIALVILVFAYEVASVTGKKVSLPNTKCNEINESVKDSFSLDVETDNCYMYFSSISERC